MTPTPGPKLSINNDQPRPGAFSNSQGKSSFGLQGGRGGELPEPQSDSVFERNVTDLRNQEIFNTARHASRIRRKQGPCLALKSVKADQCIGRVKRWLTAVLRKLCSMPTPCQQLIKPNRRLPPGIISIPQRLVSQPFGIVTDVLTKPSSQLVAQFKSITHLVAPRAVVKQGHPRHGMERAEQARILKLSRLHRLDSRGVLGYSTLLPGIGMAGRG
jgi:hypothetical protein